MISNCTKFSLFEEFIEELQELKGQIVAFGLQDESTYDDDDENELRTEFETSIKKIYETMGYHRNSFVGNGIRWIKENYGINAARTAAIHLFYRIRGTSKPLDTEEMGRVAAIIIDRGIEKQYSKFDYASIESLHSEYENKLSDIDAFRDQKEKSIEQFLHRFQEVEKITRPANYWETKREKHNEHSQRLAKIIPAVVFGLGFFIFLGRECVSVPDEASWSKTISEYLPITVSLIALFWLTRVLVRLFLTQVHLANDAAERVAIIKTYQGMLEGDNELKKEERIIVLNQIFRHNQDGIVKDDAAPQLPSTFLTK